MAFNIQLFKSFRAVSPLWPTAHVVVDDVEDAACCALHKKIECGIAGGTGCVGLPHGTHYSIRALYTDDVYYCHAETGQKVIDQNFYHFMINPSRAFTVAAIARTSAFRKRYMAGFAIGVGAYGAGYCYLHLIDETARSRIARCLGPLPLLADVVRAAMYVGKRDLDKVVISLVGDGVYHIDSKALEGSDDLSVVLKDCMIAIAKGANARVGMDYNLSDDSEIAINDVSIATLKHAIMKITRKTIPCSGNFVTIIHDGFTNGMVGEFSAIRHMIRGNHEITEMFGGVRLSGLIDWFKSKGVVLNGDAIEDLALATCCAAVIPFDLVKLKQTCKMWAILGDSIIRMAMAVRAIVNGCDVDSFVVANQKATNVNLAKKFNDIGLRGHCLISGLSVESKANADMFEAIIGVVAIHHDSMIVNTFMENIGLVSKPIDLDSASVDDQRVGLVRGLNSQQIEIAVCMRDLGII